jgi:cysteine desulfurase/selenocysteine lyase
LHERFGIPASTRASFYLYSAKEEVDALVEGLYEVKKVFA